MERGRGKKEGLSPAFYHGSWHAGNPKERKVRTERLLGIHAPASGIFFYEKPVFFFFFLTVELNACFKEKITVKMKRNILLTVSVSSI